MVLKASLQITNIISWIYFLGVLSAQSPPKQSTSYDNPPESRCVFNGVHLELRITIPGTLNKQELLGPEHTMNQLV
ncbi:hypothetical protein BJV74DRAFT_821291 [Russula compacta]|nr:hypothetical protein BJV74DRAFT_821291 [Russula compacta]